LGTNVVFPVVGTYVEVWGVAQRSSCLRGMTVIACRDAGWYIKDYDKNEPSHSYCNLIFRKNLTVLKGRNS